MRLTSRQNALELLLKQCYSTPRCCTQRRARSYATAASGRGDGKDIAVLGGGITGLSTAYYLSKALPRANITLYEASERLGGWMDTKRVEVGNGTVLLEQGPRTLRPAGIAGLVTLDLICKLGIEDEVLVTKKDSVSAQNRFIYYPDHLVRMPGPGMSMGELVKTALLEPVMRGSTPGVFGEFMRDQVPVEPGKGVQTDESIGSFISRRLNKSMADNLVSAVMHGIYAGDIYQLSAKSILPTQWHLEKRYGSITMGMMQAFRKQMIFMPERDAHLHVAFSRTKLSPLLRDKMKDASVYTFKGGLEQLSVSLAKAIANAPNVTTKTNHSIKSLTYDLQRNGGIKLTTTRNQPPTSHTHAISALPSSTLASITSTPTTNILPSLSATPSVTVMVVNLYYTSPYTLPVHGFGYLLPRSIPLEQNHERALGVVFDSDAVSGQDTATGTKLTVMMGGHWWDNWTSYPSPDEAIEMAQAVVARHLHITEPAAVTSAALHRNCIPQYTVGHAERMSKAHRELRREFKGRLRVVGNSYTGVGVNDCVRASYEVVDRLANEVGTTEGEDLTGLDMFERDALWVAGRIPKAVGEDE
ncbi:MAG: hypothetical protein M1819_002435 [Sarea resinae]|nr:MAG: hypothetical protein M1819_002435 [Sarea resinae]